MPSPVRDIKLMTFNIAHARGLSLYQGFSSTKRIYKNLDRIAHIINEHQPDVVALQEIDASSHWNRHINLLDYLQSATEYPFSVHGIHNKRDGRKPLAYGNAFLSKFPTKDWKVVPFGSKSLGEKGFLEACFIVDETEIDIINLHLDFRSRKTRLRQVDQLIASIHQRGEADPYHLPPIICGDFNTSSRSSRDALHQVIERAAGNEDYRFYPQKEKTFPAHLPSRGIDFILLASPFEATNTEVIKSFASDHLPVMSQITAPAVLSTE